jgi:hypothetical protein
MLIITFRMLWTPPQVAMKYAWRRGFTSRPDTSNLRHHLLRHLLRHHHLLHRLLRHHHHREEGPVVRAIPIRLMELQM